MNTYVVTGEVRRSFEPKLVEIEADNLDEAVLKAKQMIADGTMPLGEAPGMADYNINARRKNGDINGHQPE